MLWTWVKVIETSPLGAPIWEWWGGFWRWPDSPLSVALKSASGPAVVAIDHPDGWRESEETCATPEALAIELARRERISRPRS